MSTLTPPVSSSSMAKLALQILRQAFGEITTDIARYIMNAEECTLFSLKIHFESNVDSKITITEIRDAIAVLIQHNFIKVEVPADNDDYDVDEHLVDVDPNQQTGLIYSINIDEIINRLRLPQLLVFCTKRMGLIGQCIVEELAVHGRLRKNEIVDKVKVSVRKIQADDPDFGDIDMEEESASGNIGAKVNYVTMDDYNIELEIGIAIDELAQRRCLKSVQKLQISKREKFIDPKILALSQMTADIIASRGSGGATSATAAGKRKKAGDPEPAIAVATLSNARKRAAIAQASNKSNSSKSAVANDDDDDGLPIEFRLMMEKERQEAAAAAAECSAYAAPAPVIKRENEMANSSTSKNSISRQSTSDIGYSNSSSSSGGGSAGSSHHTSSMNIKSETGLESNSSSGFISRSTSSKDEAAHADVLWTLSWDHMIRESRHELCKSIIKDRLGEKSAAIARIILDNSINTEKGYSQLNSESMSIQDITEILHRLPGHNPKQTKSLIDHMLNDRPLGGHGGIETSGILKKELQGGAGERYYVCMSELIKYVKKKSIHKIACERYDTYSARIVELLYRNKYMEQQQIGDLAIMPVREARTRLYRLYRDKWVRYLELSKRNDFSPSSTYYFWHLDKEKITQALMDDMYKTALNMMIRRQVEMVQSESELNIARRENHREGKIFDKIRQINYSLMKFDQTILLFSRF